MTEDGIEFRRVAFPQRDSAPERDAPGIGPDPAILLLGPTGSGKTPLGNSLVQRGLWGRRCVHFDFGGCLRASIGPRGLFKLSEESKDIVRDSLQTGRLLRDDEFFVAYEVFNGFVARFDVERDALVVLNGLPRHAGQATAVESLVHVHYVVHLVCDAETVVERLRRNSGGDRTGRDDDDLELVRKKLEIFRKETLPLLDHYRSKGVRVTDFCVGTETRPASIVEQLEQLGS